MQSELNAGLGNERIKMINLVEMKLALILLMLLAGCTPTVDEFKAAEKKCAEINRVARPFSLSSEILCCDNVDCGVIAK